VYPRRIRGRRLLVLGSGALVALLLASTSSAATWGGLPAPPKPKPPAAKKKPKAKKPKPKPKPTPAIRFAERPGLLELTTPGYVLTLSRRNGGIASLLDRAANVKVLTGQGGCIWGARAGGSTDYLGGCSFSPAGTSRFSYRWSQATKRLTLEYRAQSSAPGLSATAALSASNTWFDLQTRVENHLGRVLSSILVPADLVGPSAAVSAGYAPNFLPGIKLGPGFFKGTRGNVLTYPGRWAWGDYLAFDAGQGHFALYSANPDPNPLRPVEIGFARGEPGTFCSDTRFCIAHSFDTWVVDGATWTSPTVRIRLGETVDKSLQGYRRDNGIDAYPSVADKLGAKAGTYERSPLIKADPHKGLPPFAGWGAELERLPSPALIHPVHYQPGLFDQFDPDFLPPDPRFGTARDFRSMVAAAHDRAMAVMPYLNVSWWNAESPTVKQLLAKGGPEQFAALELSGRPRIEPYTSFTGYVVSPYTTAVKQRVGTLMDQFQAEAPADCYFFDQIGARPWIRDYNPAAPDSLSYYDGWLQLMAPLAPRCLMVEDGWDRLAKSFSGFHGGLLVVQRESQEADYLFGSGNWEPYPLAPMLLHDKVLLYQHDLSERTMTTDPWTLTFNMAYGFVLSYDWDANSNALFSPWLDVVGSYQHALGAYSAGQPLQSFGRPAANVTETRYPSLTVLANWSESTPYAVDGFGVAPTGFLARSSDGAAVAGSFSGTFDGAALSPGTHHILVTRTSGSVTVHQPLGSDTQLSVRLPSSWQAGNPVVATAYGSDGRSRGTVEGTVQNGRFVFACAGPQPGLPAPTYVIIG
jgi:hypothetical protein